MPKREDATYQTLIEERDMNGFTHALVIYNEKGNKLCDTCNDISKASNTINGFPIDELIEHSAEDNKTGRLFSPASPLFALTHPNCKCFLKLRSKYDDKASVIVNHLGETFSRVPLDREGKIEFMTQNPLFSMEQVQKYIDETSEENPEINKEKISLIVPDQVALTPEQLFEEEQTELNKIIKEKVETEIKKNNKADVSKIVTEISGLLSPEQNKRFFDLKKRVTDFVNKAPAPVKEKKDEPVTINRRPILDSIERARSQKMKTRKEPEITNQEYNEITRKLRNQLKHLKTKYKKRQQEKKSWLTVEI